MCGIAGVYSIDPLSIEDFDAVKKMVESLQHRGPDSSGFFHSSHLAMGMRRLRINDINHGDQPIKNESGENVLICNGEIYS